VDVGDVADVSEVFRVEVDRLIGFYIHVWHPVLKSNGRRGIDGCWCLVWVSRDNEPGKSKSRCDQRSASQSVTRY
jgi:hypothetical protein